VTTHHAERVILASASPQRKQLLSMLAVDFDVQPTHVEELTEGDPAEVVLENARRKARAGATEGALVIGCDTDVALDGELLGKPGDEEEARDFLDRLAGRTHEVHSGLVLLGPAEDQERSALARSAVEFRALIPAERDRYVASGEWRGRAGGYAVQGLGSTLVAAVRGDISNVIGLPIGALLELAPELAPGGADPAQ
jgi:septum formation protein